MFCASFELGGDAASAALRSAAPAIVRGFLPPADVNFSASGSLRVDVSPAEHANIPLKLLIRSDRTQPVFRLSCCRCRYPYLE